MIFAIQLAILFGTSPTNEVNSVETTVKVANTEVTRQIAKSAMNRTLKFRRNKPLVAIGITIVCAYYISVAVADLTISKTMYIACDIILRHTLS